MYKHNCIDKTRETHVVGFRFASAWPNLVPKSGFSLWILQGAYEALGGARLIQVGIWVVFDAVGPLWSLEVVRNYLEMINNHLNMANNPFAER